MALDAKQIGRKIFVTGILGAAIVSVLNCIMDKLQLDLAIYLHGKVDYN